MVLSSNWGSRFSLNFLGRVVVSSVLVLISQFSLTFVPRYLPASSVAVQLSLSVLILLAITGIGRCCKKILQIRASAPAFVLFNIFFIWAVYICIVRKAVSGLMDVVFNGEIAFLIAGFFRILRSDPGFVSLESVSLNEATDTSACGEVESGTSRSSIICDHPIEETSASARTVRYCRTCKKYVMGFDHHCPAFGNCIGRKNHFLFMVLLVGFLITEVSYGNLSRDLTVSTKLFSLLQVLWQGVFLAWHIYCICYNIRTDEWINWKKYPEFQVPAQLQSDEAYAVTNFRNPYDKGIIQNFMEFLTD
ncbi:Palmitoyltransferase, DHHC domain [Dillenia turbinata]|uniref:S-acyltransferase n=1 Tax=Dillenia turbinata TaxID=194707 RepID=A0AAN8ZJ25_9MAGN